MIHIKTTLNYLALLILLFVKLNFCEGQVNLLPNGSFEDTVGCPNNVAELSKTTYWLNPTLASPDYYNSCASLSGVSVPSNLYGDQNAKEGSAYAGIVISSVGNNYREYLSVKLTKSLEKNKIYKLTMYVSHADFSAFYSNNLGAYFSDANVFYSIYNNIGVSNFFNYESIIFNDDDWKEISFNYTAIGNENYVTIGNFKDDLSTQQQIKNINLSNEGYYYIDNITLVEETNNLIFSQILTPNGDGKNDVFKIANENFMDENFTIEIFNRWGNSIFKSNNKNFYWDGTYLNNPLPASTYFVLINGTTNQGTPISYKNYIQLIR